MGGASGEVRGKSKAEVYRKYALLCSDMDGIMDDQIPDAKYKKRCKSLMKQDPETGEWVLPYRLHT